MKSDGKFAGLGLLTAIAASMCCITPIVALIAGTSGAASSMSWLEPARPYLIGLTLATLGFAWYQKLKPQKEVDCCAPKEKQKFIQTKLFLGIVTAFAIVMLTLPYYSHVFYSENDASGVPIATEDAQLVEYAIDGMTCESCEIHVSSQILELEGIGSAVVSYDEGTALVEFDKNKTTIEEIEDAINSTGYSVDQITEK
ncbi:mercuric transport protein MerTP [Sanyastnella coralliicola]|uniref:mercuric transport protein MerTP n=1 Tax=Sanyastnella coralliicola TaxID=3069118 RepID=UPI0027B9F80C|nr:mercuric transport protein MerTP [Longitalea sp. SCSIO 12813]